MHAVECGQGSEGASAQRQDGCTPRVVDDVTQGAVEVADHQQGPAFEMDGSRVNGRANRDRQKLRSSHYWGGTTGSPLGPAKSGTISAMA